MVVIDAETTGVDWKRDRVAGWAACWGPKPQQAVYLPIRHEGGKNLDEKVVLRWMRDAVKGRRVIGHSIKFDLHMAQNDGFQPDGPVECTQVNEALIDENRFKYSLEDCATYYPQVEAKKGEELYAALAARFGGEATRQAQIGNLWRLAGDDRLAGEYAIGDVRTTWQLRAAQHKEIAAQNLEKVWDIESRLTRVLWRMERNGVRVHERRMAWLERWLGQIERKNRQEIGDINVRSTPQIAEFLESKGLDRGQWRTTERGNPSFTEAWLNTHPWGAKIVAVRKVGTLLASFVNPLKESHLWNGRVHCNFNQLKQDDYGTVTGRLSSNGPNMQQVPKRDQDLAPLFRMLFLPEEGHQWLAADYNQQEYRIFAEYLNNQRLIDGYLADPPVDIHSNVAEMLGVERDPTAKRMNFGLINGMGPVKLAGHLGISIAQAKGFWAAYDQNLPEARQFLRAAESYAQERGWVRTKLYRRRRFPDRRFAHKAGNSIIQGTAADCTKSKMVEVDEYLASEKAESKLLLSVHDELDLSVAPDEEKVVKRCVEIMEAFGPEDLIQFKVPMRVDAKESSDWGRASFPKFEKWPKGV